MKTMTIGQVAREAGLGVETLRFYEREGWTLDPLMEPATNGLHRLLYYRAGLAPTS